jgi:hypothetical protein
MGVNDEKMHLPNYTNYDIANCAMIYCTKQYSIHGFDIITKLSFGLNIYMISHDLIMIDILLRLPHNPGMYKVWDRVHLHYVSLELSLLTTNPCQSDMNIIPRLVFDTL